MNHQLCVCCLKNPASVAMQWPPGWNETVSMCGDCKTMRESPETESMSYQDVERMKRGERVPT